jgi:NarL family two-component system sensor histidine kinase LiaS
MNKREGTPLMQTFIRRFTRLQWKLTFSYALLTGVVLLLFEILAIGVIFWVVNANLPSIVLSGAQQEVPQAATYFAGDVPDWKGLSAWLNIPNPYANGSYQGGTIVDTQGRVLATAGDTAIHAGMPLQTRLSAQSMKNLRAVLAGGATSQGLVNQETDGSIVAIVPIVGKDKTVQAALVLKTNTIAQANGYWVSYYLLYVVLPSLLFILFIAGVIGPIAGFFTARNFTRRFQKLSVAADNWGKGNFSTLVQDTSSDELGQLTRHLNRMVEQLQNMLQTSQKLAVLEERNRLARDLHDSVKQHIFVVALQVGTAKLHLEPNAEKVQRPLAEAEHVLLQVQEELQTLIRELRPVALEDKGFGVALQELASQWTQQTSIPTDVQLERKQVLPLLVEEAFYRIVQEALANVARHSQATKVLIRLVCEQEHVLLSIQDNGQGFALAGTKGKGFGLLSMQERMNALGGDVSIESTKEQGTRIVARCPKTAQ